MRTVNGKPVGEEQIELIVNTIIEALEIKQSDILLDLCCGNGALSDRIFSVCNGGLGVDFSEPLIEIARRYFQSFPHRKYELWDIEDYVSNTQDTGNFTKCLCYGSFMFLPEEKASNVLRRIHSRFQGIDRIFIGNLPDKARLTNYLTARKLKGLRTDDPSSPIGIWRSTSDFIKFAGGCGWDATIKKMPDNFYGASYRYDALLCRGSG